MALIGPDERHDHATCDGYINESPDRTLEYLFSEKKLQEVCGSKAGALRVKPMAGSCATTRGRRLGE
jgi:hypothetical protein